MAFSLWSRVLGGVVGLIGARTAADATQPIFELVEQEGWNANPNRVLPLNTLAELVATAIVDPASAGGEAQRTGWNANKLAAVVQLALRAPTIGDARDMRRRGAITDEQFRHALRKAGLEPQYDEAAFELLDLLASPSDLITMAVREVFDPAQRAALDLDAEFPPAFAARAAELGIPPELARDHWAAHWQLPSYEQLAEMLFRGELTPQQFRAALKAIDYAPTWRGKLEAIARRIPTPTDFQRLVRREVYNPAQRAALDLDAEFPPAFAEKMALHGMSEQDARDLWAGGWRLPSARQGYQMVWRGEMGLPELKGLLKALDYAPTWRDKLFNIAFLVPGRIDLKRMLRYGIKTRGELVAGYQRIGYNPADAELMTQIAEAELATSGGEASYIGRARTTLFNRVHTEYVSRQLTSAEAQAGLQAVGVPAGEIGPIVAMWSRETELVRTELTQAQIVKAFKKGLYDEATALAELRERGLTEQDAITRLASG